MDTLGFAYHSITPPQLSRLILGSSRLRLVALQAGFTSDIFREFTAEITTYMFPRPPQHIRETETFVTNALTGMRGGWEVVQAITAATTGEFLGCVGLHGHNKGRRPELGIWLKKAAHGQRYGQEAIHTLAAWAVDTIKLDYFVYPVDRANVPSRKIPESLGGTVEATETVTGLGGNVLDLVVYHIQPAAVRAAGIAYEVEAG